MWSGMCVSCSKRLSQLRTLRLERLERCVRWDLGIGVTYDASCCWPVESAIWEDVKRPEDVCSRCAASSSTLR